MKVWVGTAILEIECDDAFMGIALRLARRGLGRVAPNPSVGCVLVRPDLGGRVVGRGWTQPGGRPHAETEALSRAGGLAKGATAYVTLEPCSHHGKTPPCAEALIEAGIKRAVVAIEDPDPRVSGRGNQALRDAGIIVDTGLSAAEARRVNAGFLSKLERGCPHITLKVASSLDGMTATRTGQSKWITGPEARRWGHGLRARSDAILVGSGTALADDPSLTCKIPGLTEHSPVRVVLDGRARLPLTSTLAKTAEETAMWWVVSDQTTDERVAPFRKKGVKIIRLPSGDDGFNADIAARRLSEEGVGRLMIEGGSSVTASFVKAGLVDEIYWFQAPVVIGGDGTPGVGGFGLEDLARSGRYHVMEHRRIGGDQLMVLEKAPTSA